MGRENWESEQPELNRDFKFADWRGTMPHDVTLSFTTTTVPTVRFELTLYGFLGHCLCIGLDGHFCENNRIRTSATRASIWRSSNWAISSKIKGVNMRFELIQQEPQPCVLPLTPINPYVETEIIEISQKPCKGFSPTLEHVPPNTENFVKRNFIRATITLSPYLFFCTDPRICTSTWALELRCNSYAYYSSAAGRIRTFTLSFYRAVVSLDRRHVVGKEGFSPSSFNLWNWRRCNAKSYYVSEKSSCVFC